MYEQIVLEHGYDKILKSQKEEVIMENVDKANPYVQQNKNKTEIAFWFC